VLTRDYLNLKLVSLKASERWNSVAEALSFLFPNSGTGHSLKGSSKQPLSCGDVFVSNGDAVIAPAGSAEFSFCSFSVRRDHLFPLFATSEIALLQTAFDALKGARLYPAAGRLAQECHKLLVEVPPQTNLDHRGQLLRLAALILNEEFKCAQEKRVGFVRVEDHMAQVFEKLSADEMLSLSVPELARKFSCSRRHLNRLFHQHFGFSVAALRIEMRLMKAVSLLRDSDAKVINVAEECGFNHLGLFNTCFKRRFGTSPGQWRKTATQDHENFGRQNGDKPGCPLITTGLCPWPARLKPKDRPVSAARANGESTGDLQKKGRPKINGTEKSPAVDVTFAVAAVKKPAGQVAFQVRAPG
jgi:AraC-like DNA-binding protein